MAGASSIIGAGAAIGGSLLSSRQSSKNAKNAAQAAQFNPFNVQLPGGSGVSFSGNTATGTLSAEEERLRSALLARSAQSLGGTDAARFMEQFGQSFGAGNIAGVAEDFLGAGAGMGEQTGLFNQRMGDMFAQSQGLAGDFQSRVLGPNVNDQRAGALFNQGQGLMGSSFQDVADQRLSLLREQAAPFEERAADATFNRLFSQGRLGSTGGGRDIEAFARGLGQADQQRILDSQTMADTLRQQDRQAGLNLQQQALGFQGQSAAERGMFGNLMTNQQRLGGDLASQGFAQNLAGNQFDLSRGAQRMAGLQGLFSFGQDVPTQQLNQSLGALGGSQAIDTGMRNLIALGGNIGGQQASAGAQAGNFMQAIPSTAGGFLSGLGSAVSDMNF